MHVVRYVRYVDPESVASVRVLNRDRIVKVLGVRAVDGYGSKVAQVLAFAQVPTGARCSLFLYSVREPARGLYRGEERLVNVARVVGRSEDLCDLAAQGAALLADAYQDYVPGLGVAPELAGDQDWAPLLDEQGVRDRVFPPAYQLGRQDHGERRVRVLRSNTR